MPVAGPIIGAVGSLAGGKQSSKAAGDASQAQVQSGREAIQAQLAMYNQSRADSMPYMQTGYAALNELNALYGLPQQALTGTGTGAITMTGGEKNPAKKRTLFDKFTDPLNIARQFGGTSYDPAGLFSSSDTGYAPMKIAVDGMGGGTGPQTLGQITGQVGATQKTPQQLQQEAFAKFRSMPGYQFGLDEGLKAIQGSAAASGGLFSGKAGKALWKYGNDYADQQGFTPYANRLASLAGVGQVQTNNQANLGQAYSQNFANTMTNMGNARASGLLNQGQARSNMWSDVAGFGGMLASQWGRQQPAVTGVTNYGAFAPNNGSSGFTFNSTGWM